MNAHSIPKSAGAGFVLPTLLALILLPNAAQAGSDRIFADGFEPCCQVGGTVSGVTGSGLVLHLSVGAIDETLQPSGNGPYQFATTVAPGTIYHASLSGFPSGQFCTIVNFIGTMGSADVTDVNVVCGDHMNWNQSVWGRSWQ